MSARAEPVLRAAARPHPGAPRPLWAAAFCISCLAPACAPENARAALGSTPIERLAFVPPARVTLSSQLEVGNEKALLVSQFEVTRGEWRAWAVAQHEPGSAGGRAESWESATDSWPANFVSLEESRRYASSQGMRLPSSSEWLRIACGSAAAPYPWGPSDAASVANTLELGLRQPAPVGTFEQGRAPLEVYDLLGNVWEWVDDPPEKHAPLAWAMGGSYLTLRQPLFDARADESGTLHLELDPRSRSNEIGLRLVADAREWLGSHLEGLAQMPSAEQRLAAVGRRWGPSAVPLLEELALLHPGQQALAWLLAGARR